MAVAASYDFPQDLVDAQDELTQVRAELRALYQKVPWSAAPLDAWETQVIAGHDSLNTNTTMGYAAIYPTDAIEAHRAFIARRRASRPAEEYRAVTPEEWDEFLSHFERRKLALGECGRAYGTDCSHEHACVRCPVLILNPIDRPRLEEIRYNLHDRIAEAEREGWFGEAEGLRVSLAAAEQKIAQLDARRERRKSPVFLEIPVIGQISGRTS